MTHRANAKHKFLNHNSRYINFMQIALDLYHSLQRFLFSKIWDLGQLMQILIDLLNSCHRLVGEQHKWHSFYLAKTDPLEGVNDKNILPYPCKWTSSPSAFTTSAMPCRLLLFLSAYLLNVQQPLFQLEYLSRHWH